MKKLPTAAVTGLVAAAMLSACSSGGTGATSSGGGVFTTVNEAHPITAGAPMNPFNPSGNTFDSYDQMELGYPKSVALNPNAFFPALAASWQLENNGLRLVVHLQPRARWSTGAPVTAEDVKLSAAIAFTQGTQPSNLENVTILGPKELAFNAIPGTTNQLFTSEVLDITVVPTSVYGTEVPADIWSTIAKAEYTGTAKPRVAAATKAQATLASLGKTIAAFAPATDVSAGPFVLKRLNPGEALLVRNPDFYNVGAISPAEVEMRNYTGNQQIWNYLIAGELDAAPYTAMPENVLHSILATKGNQEVTSPSFVAAALAFNEKDYPYGLLAVRKAFAYLLNRQEITKVGEAVSGTATKYQVGLIDSIVPAWLSPAQRTHLHLYPYDPAKAKALLEGAGFTERGGSWYLPNGHPWSVTIETVSGFSDWIAAGKFMASELTSFGIPATMSIASSYAEYLKELALGDYSVGFWLNALGPSVYNAYSRIWGSDDGYNVVGNSVQRSSTGNWLNAPATYTLPSVGTINPAKLTAQLSELSSTAAKPVVAELAEADNLELPMINLWNYINVQFVNTTRFTDFPIGHNSLLNDPPGLWMINGFVKRH